MRLTQSATLVVCSAALALVTLSAGCGQSPPAPRAIGDIHLAKRSELTPAEVKYGVAPVQTPAVTYQPDVVIVGGGADAVRAVGTNGFTWTIDAAAPHANEIAEGKVFFLTGRAVGRVLNVRRDGGNLIVIVGPVDITDVIREANITIDMPVDFGEAIPYTTPDFPGAVSQAEPLQVAAQPEVEGEGPHVVLVSQSTPDAQTPPELPPDVSNLIDFKVVPFANSSGVGLTATSDKGEMRLKAEAAVHLATPQLHAVLKIGPGRIDEASVELKGAAGLTMKFEAGTDVGRRANVNGRFQPDTDFSIPVFGLGVPFAVTVRQQVIIKTALGVRNSTLSATGDYAFGGSFKVGYVRGQSWGVFGPTGFSAKQSLLQTTGGVSLGASGFNMAHQLKVIMGIGTAGFVTGPFFSFTSGVGVARMSDIGMLTCHQATISVKLTGGVGYLIPKAVTSAINFVLRALNIKYRVVGEGGFSSDPTTIVESTGSAPNSKACGGG